MKKYFTYIIESSVSSNWYIGHTNDIDRRFAEHNSGQNKSTKNKGPWKLIFLKQFDNNLEANRFELNLKKLRNKNFIENEYAEFFLNT
ncbi:MAG TPA: GIY-YIG nuclease family protein [Ignavibacteriaceae bacterium]|nr:GIY-YIG nuclease family protein [Ignavibacteriaceae bacterium]